MKRYPIYKENGVEWLGSLPASWQVKKMKFVALIQFSNVDKKSFVGEKKALLCNYMDVYNNEFIENDINFMEATANEKEIDKFFLQKGDVLVTKDSETPDDIAVAALVKDELKGIICGYHLAQIRPDQKNLLGQYLFRLFQTKIFREQFFVSARGVTRFGLSNSIFSNAYIALPSLKEQSIIAEYLNYKTHQINTLIEKKQKQIELLKEQRAAIINQAVTKGLDPNVKMKDSGIEGLGYVPTHWKITKIRRIVNDHKQGYYTQQDYIDNGTKLLRITDIDDYSNVDFSNCPHVLISEDEREIFNLKPKDFVFARSGTIGRFGIIRSKEDVVFASYLIRFRFSGKVFTELLKYFLLSEYLRSSLLSDLHGGANQNIHAENIKCQIIALPSTIPEQKQIAQYLETEIEKIDSIIVINQREIELLKEYRTTLTSEAVTGKIDVRDEVIP